MWTTGGDDDDVDDGDGSLEEPGNPRAARICTIIMQRRVEKKKTDRSRVGGVVAENEKQIGPGGKKEYNMSCSVSISMGFL